MPECLWFVDVNSGVIEICDRVELTQCGACAVATVKPRQNQGHLRDLPALHNCITFYVELLLTLPAFYLVSDP